MPRATAVNTDPATDVTNEIPADSGNEATEEVTDSENGSGEDKPSRRTYTRKPLPEGVDADSLGYGELVPEEPPVVTRNGRGRGPDPKIRSFIATMKDNPGQYYRLGNFRSRISPDGAWKEAGIEFKHAPFTNEQGEVVEGIFVRYGRFPGAES